MVEIQVALLAGALLASIVCKAPSAVVGRVWVSNLQVGEVRKDPLCTAYHLERVAKELVRGGASLMIGRRELC